MFLSASKSVVGKPPEFDGLSGKVHDRVREEMRQVLTESALVPFLDQEAAVLLAEARENFMRLGLNTRIVIRAGGGVRLFSWKGDWVTDIRINLHFGIPAAIMGMHQPSTISGAYSRPRAFFIHAAGAGGPPGYIAHAVNVGRR